MLVRQIQKCSYCVFVLLLSFKKPIKPFEQSIYKHLRSGSLHKHRIVEVARHLWRSSGVPPAEAGPPRTGCNKSTCNNYNNFKHFHIDYKPFWVKIVSLTVLHCLASDQEIVEDLLQILLYPLLN